MFLDLFRILLLNRPMPCCPEQKIIDTLSKKWNLLILRFMEKEKTMRYCNLQEAIPDINSRMLSERLTELEEEGFIERIVKETKPICIEYKITEKGKDLRKIFDCFCQWTKKWE